MKKQTNWNIVQRQTSCQSFIQMMIHCSNPRSCCSGKSTHEEMPLWIHARVATHFWFPWRPRSHVIRKESSQDFSLIRVSYKYLCELWLYFFIFTKKFHLTFCRPSYVFSVFSLQSLFRINARRPLKNFQSINYAWEKQDHFVEAGAILVAHA